MVFLFDVCDVEALVMRDPCRSVGVRERPVQREIPGCGGEIG